MTFWHTKFNSHGVGPGDCKEGDPFTHNGNERVQLSIKEKVVELDGTGRLLIPKDLHSFAGISKQVVLAAVGNIVEVWDKERYEKAIDDATVDFAELAEEVMGGDNITDDELS